MAFAASCYIHTGFSTPLLSTVDWFVFLEFGAPPFYRIQLAQLHSCADGDIDGKSPGKGAQRRALACQTQSSRWAVRICRPSQLSHIPHHDDRGGSAQPTRWRDGGCKPDLSMTNLIEMPGRIPFFFNRLVYRTLIRWADNPTSQQTNFYSTDWGD